MVTNIQKENRVERIAICRAEKVPDEEIRLILSAYPALYGTEESQ